MYIRATRTIALFAFAGSLGLLLVYHANTTPRRASPSHPSHTSTFPVRSPGVITVASSTTRTLVLPPVSIDILGSVFVLEIAFQTTVVSLTPPLELWLVREIHLPSGARVTSDTLPVPWLTVHAPGMVQAVFVDFDHNFVRGFASTEPTLAFAIAPNRPAPGSRVLYSVVARGRAVLAAVGGPTALWVTECGAGDPMAAQQVQVDETQRRERDALQTEKRLG
jgi:hypothetical protein